MDVCIDHLFNRPSHIAAAAQLIYEAFWLGKSGYSPVYFAGRLREADDPDRLPLSLVAIAGDATIGTINLIDNDDEARTHLWPWLAALVVVPAWRGRGVGTRLVQTLLVEAWRLRIDMVYFGTDGPAFYRRLGARLHEQATPQLCVMRFERDGAVAPA